MLPWLSSLSVSTSLVRRLRDWCSSRSLQISPLHREFPSLLLGSSLEVSNAVPRLSRGISHPTFQAACGPFTPNESEQRLPPLNYRGCWHRVSRGFLSWYRQIFEIIHLENLLPRRQEFTTRRPSSSTRRRSVRLSPIAEDSRLLPPVGVWAVSQSQCG